ncbi:hypothetical protein DFH07DRAFT_825852 [Mycena maculata]|uniref:Uncharacterized protein n=1 Tax=Mycena maculata TaxID=230809 RepID=A0AAD7IWB3_9AGAR|nr:hypothetical protein DFH07DRAFT_825852 [Mycena maculata]
MRAYSSLPLDDDIVDRIMTFCPTFGTLQATILVSKAFYRVFQIHPKSITRAVAYNIVGPALPQALRMIRYPYDEYETDDSHALDATAMATACPEEQAVTIITAMEKIELQEESKMVGTLEDIYSLTNKDRMSRTSLLTSEESWRFRRAIYRIKLFCRLFSIQCYGNFEELDDDEFDDDMIQRIRAQRMAIPNEYPADELLQLYSVVAFMKGIFADVLGEAANSSSVLVDVLLATGPDGALRAWEERSPDSLQDDHGFGLFADNDNYKLFAGYFAIPFKNIWTARNITPPKDDDPPSKWILDQVNGANDTCSQCAAPGGLKLFTPANWDRLDTDPLNLLKGNLRQNTTVTTPFTGLTAHLYDPPAIEAWISELFTLRQSPDFDGWEAEDSYCRECLTKFLEAHVWRWFLDTRLKAGWAPPEDCWYGWNCRTQTHKLGHAQTKNHLCVPTRGDRT